MMCKYIVTMALKSYIYMYFYKVTCICFLAVVYIYTHTVIQPMEGWMLIRNTPEIYKKEMFQHI